MEAGRLVAARSRRLRCVSIYAIPRLSYSVDMCVQICTDMCTATYRHAHLYANLPEARAKDAEKKKSDRPGGLHAIGYRLRKTWDHASTISLGHTSAHHVGTQLGAGVT